MTYIIKVRKKDIEYNDSNIKTKYRNTDEQRKNLLLSIIGNNPKIPHTHLLKMALEYGKSSAKRPYEDLLNELEGVVLQSEKIGKNSNSQRLWELMNSNSIQEKEFRKEMRKKLDSAQHSINDLPKLLANLTAYEKALLLTVTLKGNSENLLLAKFGSHIFNFKTELKELEKLEKQIYKIISDNPDCLLYVNSLLGSFNAMTAITTLGLSDVYLKRNKTS